MKSLFFTIILAMNVGVALAADPGWSVNTSSFNYSMTVTAVLQTGCQELTATNNRLGAFVNGVVRGSALSSVTANGRQLVFLTVYSNQIANEVVTFKVYNAQTDAIIDVATTLVFQDDASFGEPGAPILMTENNVPTNLRLSSATVMENNTVGVVIGALQVNDLDLSDTHSFSLVAGAGDADNASFSISGANLALNAVADYETKTSYSIRAMALDNKGCSVAATLTITVLPFNDPPTDISLSANSINENVAAGQAIGLFTSTDVDLGDTFTYTLVAGTGDTDNTLFQIVGTELRTLGALNFEVSSTRSIRVRTTDSGTGTFEKVFTITVLNVNEAPGSLGISANSIDENLPAGTVVGTFNAVDEDAGDVVTITLDPANTNQATWFEIVNNQLQTKVPFNFEDVALYPIQIIATDAGGLSASMGFDITILDANDAPTDLNLSKTTILEDLPASSLVGEFTSTDEDESDTHSYSLVSGTNDNDSFTIDANQLLSSKTFKFKEKETYQIEVMVTDAGGATFSKPFTITIEKINSTLPSINVISPNGDGINDTWVIQNVENYSNFNLKIYDSSGGLVYSRPGDYDNSWNGTQGGSRLPTGTYYFILSSNSSSGRSYSGTISLLN